MFIRRIRFGADGVNRRAPKKNAPHPRKGCDAPGTRRLTPGGPSQDDAIATTRAPFASTAPRNNREEPG